MTIKTNNGNTSQYVGIGMRHVVLSAEQMCTFWCRVSAGRVGWQVSGTPHTEVVQYARRNSCLDQAK